VAKPTNQGACRDSRSFHVSWLNMSNHTPFEDLDPKTLAKLGKKLDKMRNSDSYEYNEIAGEVTDEPEKLLWHLVREGLLLNQVKSMGIVSALTNALDFDEGVSCEDILKVLKRLPENMMNLDKDTCDWAYSPGVPSGVDALITHAYVLDSEALLRGRAELSPNLQLAIDFVHGRFGGSVDSESALTILRHMAVAHCEDGLDCNWDLKVSPTESVTLSDTDAVRSLALRFGNLSEWASTQRDWLRTHVRMFTEYVGIASRGVDGMRLLTLSDLVYLLAKADTNYNVALPILDAREDSPSSLLEAAQRLSESGVAAFRIDAEQAPAKSEQEDDEYGGDDDYGDDDYGDDDYDDYYDEEEDYDEDEDVEGEVNPADFRISELLTVVALNRAQRAEHPTPTTADALLNLAGVHTHEHEFIPRLRAALESMGQERCHEVVRRIAANEYFYSRALAIVDVYFDEALAVEVLDRCDAGPYKLDVEYLPYCKLALLPLLIDRVGRASTPERSQAYQEGLLLLLASASARGEQWPEARDKEIRLDALGVSSSRRRDPVIAMLAALPLERTEAILRANLSHCAKEPWRLVQCLRAGISESLLEELFAAVVAAKEAVEYGSFGDEGLRELGEDAVRPWRKALHNASVGERFSDELRRVMGPHADAIFSESDMQVESKMEEFARLVGESSGPTERIYILENDDAQPSAKTVARIGGTPLGIDAAPEFNGKPMTHIFTLDLAELPELADRFDGARALSLYLPDPDSAKHHNAGRLIAVQESDLEKSEGSVDDASSIVVKAFDVPSEIFRENVEGDQARIRGILYSRSAFVLGRPLWMQGGEPDATFVMQFDESFAHINLGDMGIMYLFENYIDWQCH
jgi:hypothetical protein